MRLAEYIRSQLTSPLTLAKAAAFAGYSPAYFSKQFKRLMSVPFKAYVDRERISLAKHLLLDNSSVSQTAELLQYGSTSSFCRAFHRVAGYPPLGIAASSAGQKMNTTGQKSFFRGAVPSVS